MRLLRVLHLPITMARSGSAQPAERLRFPERALHSICWSLSETDSVTISHQQEILRSPTTSILRAGHFIISIPVRLMSRETSTSPIQQLVAREQDWLISTEQGIRISAVVARRVRVLCPK